MTPNFRYFLCFQVDRARAHWLAAHLPRPAGDAFRFLAMDMFHLTLCTIAETPAPPRFLGRWVADALGAGLPAASEIRFGRIAPKAKGAALVTRGGTAEIRQLYDRIAALLAPLGARGIAPMHRKSGLHPHITIGYGECDFAPILLRWLWIPRDLVLIESHVGHRHHRVVQRWTLRPPPQGRFAFLCDAAPAAPGLRL